MYSFLSLTAEESKLESKAIINAAIWVDALIHGDSDKIREYSNLPFNLPDVLPTCKMEPISIEKFDKDLKIHKELWKDLKISKLEIKIIANTNNDLKFNDKDFIAILVICNFENGKDGMQPGFKDILYINKSNLKVSGIIFLELVPR